MIRHGTSSADPAATMFRGTQNVASIRRKSELILAKVGRSASRQPHRRPKSRRSALKSVRISVAPATTQIYPMSKTP